LQTTTISGSLFSASNLCCCNC